MYPMTLSTPSLSSTSGQFSSGLPQPDPSCMSVVAERNAWRAVHWNILSEAGRTRILRKRTFFSHTRRFVSWYHNEWDEEKRTYFAFLPFAGLIWHHVTVRHEYCIERYSFYPRVFCLRLQVDDNISKIRVNSQSLIIPRVNRVHTGEWCTKESYIMTPVT